MVFDFITTNVGGGYHKSHGTFTAPTDGVYVFSLTAMARPGHYEHLEIVKDGTGIILVYVGMPSTHSYFNSATGIATLTLSTGNEVWVQTVGDSWHGTGSLHGGSSTSFSGWLLL